MKLHSNCLRTKSSQYDNDSRYLDSLSVSGFTTASTSNLETKLQYSKQHKSYLTCLCQNQLFKFKSKQNMTATHKRLFRFTSHQTVSITYTVQALSNDPPHVANCSNCSSTQIHDYLDASENSKTTIPKQTVSIYSFTVHCQPTVSLQHQVPPCLQCHDVPSSLSLSALQYLTAKQITMPQASVSRLPVSANIRQAPLFLHTTEPQVSNISSMWQLNQGH